MRPEGPSTASIAESDLASDQDVKARIIQCAGEIFADRGFKETTIREIAKRADVNLASVNYHFGGKQPLYMQTIQAARQARHQTIPPLALESMVSADQKLRAFVESLLRRLSVQATQDWQTKLLARELMFPTPFCADQIASWYQPMFSALLQIVDELAGKTLADADRTKIGFSIVGQCLFYRVSAHTVDLFVDQRSRDEFEVSRLADHISTFSVNAIRKLVLAADESTG